MGTKRNRDDKHKGDGKDGGKQKRKEEGARSRSKRKRKEQRESKKTNDLDFISVDMSHADTGGVAVVDSTQPNQEPHVALEIQEKEQDEGGDAEGRVVLPIESSTTVLLLPPDVKKSDDAPVHFGLTEDEKKARDKRIAKAIRRKWQQKKCMLIFFFVLGIPLSYLFLFCWISANDAFGTMPTPYSRDSSTSMFIAYLLLNFTAMFGFTILSLRSSNFFIGLLFMFIAVSVVGFAVKGVSRAFYSKSSDELPGNMKFYMNNFFEVHPADLIPSFYHRLQKKCECCGFAKIDRVSDWPSLISQGKGTQNLPYTCCKSGKKCDGLAWNYDPKTREKKFKIAGGFQIVKSDEFMDRWSAMQETGIPDTVMRYRISDQQKATITDTITRTIFKGFVEEVVAELQKKKINASISDFSNERFELKAPALPHEFQVKFDTLVDEIKYHTDVFHVDLEDWLYFKIPLQTNMSHFFNFTPPEDKAFYNASPLNLFYVTKGSPENVILDQIIHHNRCERNLRSDKKIGFFTLKCGDLRNTILHDPLTNETLAKGYVEWERNTLEPTTKEKNPSKAYFFELALYKAMSYNILLGIVTIIYVVILSFIFWYFYSRVKSEELADLSSPPDFDVFTSRLSGDDYLDEDAMDFQHKLLREMIAEESSKGGGAAAPTRAKGKGPLRNRRKTTKGIKSKGEGKKQQQQQQQQQQRLTKAPRRKK